MADTVGLGGGAPALGSRSRVAANSGSSGPYIRSPRDILKDRKARMDQQAEAERLQREEAELERLQATERRRRVEEEARLVQDVQRRNQERIDMFQTNPAMSAAPVTGTMASSNGSMARVNDSGESPLRGPPAQQQADFQVPSSDRGNVRLAPQQVPASPQTASRPPRVVATQQPSQQVPQQLSQEIPTQRPLHRGGGGGGSGGPPLQMPPQPTIASDRRALEPPAVSSRPRTSFPHAFERWETLSAHWEGLTSYWVAKMEASKNDSGRDSVNQQMSRHVIDLSAAGANLFHALVELQKLRASSERKFTRWFMETRRELERAQENTARLELAVQEARSRSDKETQTSILLMEMRKELCICKEEARRSWEELGRREQEERERTLSLQSGKPTLVGGVQVVPMTMGVPSRHGSANVAAGAGATTAPGQVAAPAPAPASVSTTLAATKAIVSASGPDTALSAGIVSGPPPTSSPAATRNRERDGQRGYQAEYEERGGGSYRHQPVDYADYVSTTNGDARSSAGARQNQAEQAMAMASGRTGSADDRSEADEEDEEETGGQEVEYLIDGQGRFVRDSRGQKVPAYGSGGVTEPATAARQQPYRRAVAVAEDEQDGEDDMLDDAAVEEYEMNVPMQGRGSAPWPAGYAQDHYLDPMQAATPIWDAGRHTHPTRLSDVMEEDDERSRTSASQVSRV